MTQFIQKKKKKRSLNDLLERKQKLNGLVMDIYKKGF